MLINASKEADLEVNTEKTKYALLSCCQNAWQNYDMKIADRSYENVVQGIAVTDQNLIQEEL
jgi:hypothetical protein